MRSIRLRISFVTPSGFCSSAPLQLHSATSRQPSTRTSLPTPRKNMLSFLLLSSPEQPKMWMCWLILYQVKSPQQLYRRRVCDSWRRRTTRRRRVWRRWFTEGTCCWRRFRALWPTSRSHSSAPGTRLRHRLHPSPDRRRAHGHYRFISTLRGCNRLLHIDLVQKRLNLWFICKIQFIMCIFKHIQEH